MRREERQVFRGRCLERSRNKAGGDPRGGATGVFIPAAFPRLYLSGSRLSVKTERNL